VLLGPVGLRQVDAAARIAGLIDVEAGSVDIGGRT
jgi:hypothetical protein